MTNLRIQQTNKIDIDEAIETGVQDLIALTDYFQSCSVRLAKEKSNKYSLTQIQKIIIILELALEKEKL